ncbi:hypothetical protein HYU12_01260, partial [Candidatus Woesearchaeota archaeon]|nr:hypothetical protein [Candidatus Woesearchaeota archaeon]
MNKIASILVLSLLFSVTLSQAAAAQDIMEWFAKDQSWPPFGSNTQDNFPRWLIGLFIVTIGSLILLAVSRIKLLQESSYKNAVLALSFGIAAIAVSATTIVNNFVAIFGLTSWLAVILATISLGSLFIGLMTKGAGLGVKLGGEGVREGVAAIKGDEKKEKRDEQDENAMLSSLKSFGQQQFKQIEQVKNYLLEVDSLIQSHSQELMNDKSGLRKKLLADLNQVQTRLHTLKIEEHKVDAIISRLKSDVVDEINVFKEELQQEAQKRTQLNPQTVRNIEREVDKEIQKVIAEFRMLPELKKFVADLK